MKNKNKNKNNINININIKRIITLILSYIKNQIKMIIALILISY